MFDFLINLSRLTRPLSNVKNVAIVAFVFYLSKTHLDWVLFVSGALALSFVFSAIYALNTVSDADFDKKNENKKHYASSIKYFGIKRATAISLVCAILGLVVGLTVNVYFFSVLVLLLLTGFLYSSKYTRFKNVRWLDVIFGASLTFFLRFVASWFIFDISLPPLLPLFAVVFLKNGGYILYKGYDREYFLDSGVKNSITALSKNSIAIISALFFTLAIILFVGTCLNSIYFNVSVLGYLNIRYLWLLFVFIPPIGIQYLLFFNKIKVNVKYIRTAGLISLLLLISSILLLSI